MAMSKPETLIVDFQAPELWESDVYGLSHPLWSFVIAALPKESSEQRLVFSLHCTHKEGPVSVSAHDSLPDTLAI